MFMCKKLNYLQQLQFFLLYKENYVLLFLKE